MYESMNVYLNCVGEGTVTSQCTCKDLVATIADFLSSSNNIRVRRPQTNYLKNRKNKKQWTIPKHDHFTASIETNGLRTNIKIPLIFAQINYTIYFTYYTNKWINQINNS